MPAPQQKSLDLKLARIAADPSCRDFILADAKDADMAFGLAAPGVRPGGDPARGPYRSLDEYRHFLEVFLPNAVDRVPGKAAGERPRDVGRFLADHVVRGLAGVPRAGRPLFLKIPFLGREITEQLAAYDRSLVVGVLGGAAGTTLDAFALVAEAKASGARVALFGRKINAAEDQPAFVRVLRAVADGDLIAEEGVRAYHGELARLGIRPRRTLEDDLARTTTASAYGG